MADDEVSTSCCLCGNFVEVFLKTVTGQLSVALMFRPFFFFILPFLILLV